MAYIGQGAGVGLAADATVTNLTVTGTVDFDASGNIDGPVTGATTAAAGTFTTLSATTLTAASLAYPTSDGTAGQVISTDGSGTLSFADAGAAITMADQWRLTADHTANSDITSNWERINLASSGTIGTGMTESSGIFSFPETGIYLVMANVGFAIAAGDGAVVVYLNVTLDNSSYTRVSFAIAGNRGSSDASGTGVIATIIDVTDTANVKVKFEASSLASGSFVRGNAAVTEGAFTFIRLGDT